MVLFRLGICQFWRYEICWITTRLSQYVLMGLLLMGGMVCVAIRYFSKKVRAVRSPKPSALLEWLLHWVPGIVPDPFHNSIWLVATIQWKAPHFCALKEASLTILIGVDWFVRQLARYDSGLMALHCILIHCLGEWVGRRDWMVLGRLAGLGALLVLGVGSG